MTRKQEAIFWFFVLLAFLAAFACWLQWEPYRREYRPVTPAEIG